MASFNIELNNKPEKGSSEYALLLRLTVERKHARIKLIYSVRTAQFNPKAKNGNFIRTNHLNHKKINRYLKGKIDQAKEILDQLEVDNAVISAKLLKDRIVAPNSQDYLVYMKEYIDSLKKINKVGSYKKYNAIY